MGSIYKRGGRWWIKYYHAGRPLFESSRSTRKSDAETLLRIREGHIAEGRPFTPAALRLTFEDLVEDVENDYRTRGHPTAHELGYKLRHLSQDFEGYRAEEITTDRIRAYAARRQAEGAKNATINRELALLRRAFSLAVKAGKLWHRPHVEMLREDPPRKGFFEREAFEAVRAELPDYLYGPATFAYYIGWRKSEVFSLTWAQVDLELGIVRLEPGTTKNREGRTVFVEGELLELLELLWERRPSGCEYVFHWRGRKLSRGRDSWPAACERAGHPGMLFHDLRRTAVRNMVRRGIPERVAMAISGHKTRSVFDRYNIVSEGDLREAAGKIFAQSGSPDRERPAPLEEGVESRLELGGDRAGKTRRGGDKMVTIGPSQHVRRSRLRMVKGGKKGN